MDEEDITFEEEIEETYESGDEEQDDITFIQSHDTLTQLNSIINILKICQIELQIQD